MISLKKLAYTLFVLSLLVACGNTDPYGSAAEGETLTISGTVTDVDLGCWADATCLLTLDTPQGEATVIFGTGWSQEPKGKLIGVQEQDMMSLMGKHVTAYGKKDNDKMTIIGDESYYIELSQ